MDFENLAAKSTKRSVYGKKGMVSTSQYLASQAGLEILKKGGNAFDAIVAAAAALTVVEPTACGLGSDAFALLWPSSHSPSSPPLCLNASGWAPASISIDKVKAQGHQAMPALGVIPVTVPGAVAAWAEITKKYGKLSLEENFQPAIRYAEEGFAVTSRISENWNYYYGLMVPKSKEPVFDNWFKTFTPNGRPPHPGELFRNKELAETLREIGRTNAESFYRGDLAKKISNFMSEHKGYLSEEDLKEYKPVWVEPISTTFRDFQVWEPPPNGQGLVVLMALNTYKGYPQNPEKNDDDLNLHLQIESIKYALSDAKAYVTDPEHMDPAIQSALLSPEYAEARRKDIDPENAADNIKAYHPQKSGTVYLAAADEEGNMVSFIQSNFMRFGAGIVIPGTGISLQDRGRDYSLDPSHPNALAPKKRTYHTIVPGFLTRNGQPIGPFGVMGGYMQPQGQLQVLCHCFDEGKHPQAAIDCPRWMWSMKGKEVLVEPTFDQHKIDELKKRGHEVVVTDDAYPFGLAQIVWRLSNGCYIGGSDSRCEGGVAAW